ncbi:MAG TPA: SRPBCC domain-containing protein [Myxococcaceae bacterium]|nr:SRPBCC domain-containing protein [Myxococcaceae bacterium]
MNPADRTPPSQHATIRFEYDFAHRPEKVWRALTEPSLLERWLLPVRNLLLEEGAAFTLHADPQPGWDGTVHCKLLESEPPHRLRYSWVVGALDTVVTFTLEPTDTGTRMVLEQTGFQAHQKPAFGGARYGWGMFLGRLVELLNDAA